MTCLRVPTMTTSDPRDPVVVHRAPSRPLGELAVSLLAAEGIRAALGSFGPLAAYGGDGAPAIVRVARVDAARASALLGSWFGDADGPAEGESR